jgi:hypothetical protein
VARVGLFDPEIRAETLFDEEITQDGRFDVDLIQLVSAPPAPPATLTATGGIFSVALVWSAVPGALSYNVYRSLTSGFGYVLIQSGVLVTSTIDYAVVVGTQYFYVITAVGPGGESAYSVEDDAIPFFEDPAPHATLYDFLEMRALAIADLTALPVKIYTDFIAPVGITDLSPLLGVMARPRVLLIFSRNDSPFQVDFDAGLNPHMHTVFYAVLRQGTPLQFKISCPAESSIRMVVAGKP